MQIKAIHQFSPTCAVGDGVTNGLFFTRKLLRELGFQSEIYCFNIPDALRHEVRSVNDYPVDGQGQALLVHHSLGHDNASWVLARQEPKIIVYHNITPAEFFPPGSYLHRYCLLGRQQLRDWSRHCVGAIGDSDLNTAELLDSGYGNAVTIPMLVDIDKILASPCDDSVAEQTADTFNVLFIGRVCENKCQLDILEAFAELLHFIDRPARLMIVGGTTSEPYLQLIRDRIAELELADYVDLAGKVPADVLTGYYRAADVFLCMSEHEGFGMPLVEAMLYDVPVVAFDSSNIANTLGEGGLLLDSKDPQRTAVLLNLLASQPALRRQVIAAQRRNIERFRAATVRRQLADYLATLGIVAPQPPAAPTQDDQLGWQVEGPFDSSYSLAIVNRELARGLQAIGENVALFSTEGGGDFPPDPAWLAANPDIDALWQRSAGQPRPDVVLRFCYPPRTSRMGGRVNAFHCYGWEESGFPAAYVDRFNSDLDLITVLSRQVEKILRDNGVRLPIAVVGAGVDHILSTPAATLEQPLGKSFRFLHVSSCFPRKGIDALLAAWGKAFRAIDDVTLVIKTFPNPHNTVEQQLAALRAQDPGYPDVVLINHDVPQDQINGLYRACHALVAPSRGEGLGMPMAEAMLFDLPVITTAWGGQTDFCTPDTAWLVDYRFALADTHLGIPCSVWAEPDVGQLAAALREIYRASPAERTRRTAAARQWVEQHYSWRAVAEKTRAAVAALENQPLLRPEPRIGWVSTWQTRCGIAVYAERLACAIPADRLVILANRVPDMASAPEDASPALAGTPSIFRCWDSADKSPSSLDVLYDTIVAQQLGAVVIQFNFSFFGLPALERLVTRLKARDIGVHLFFHSTADVYHGEELKTLRDLQPALAAADRLYVHGVDDLNRLKDFGHVDNAVLFPHGVGAAPRPTPCPDVLAGKRVIASYGFLLPHKGVQALIHAFATLAESRADLHLLLLTAGYPVLESEQERQDCAALIRHYRLEERVTFMTDFLPDEQTLAWLQHAELLVFPYQHTQESSSAAVRTGLSAGVPVVVTPLPIFDDVAEAVTPLPGTAPAELAAGIASQLERLADPATRQAERQRIARWCAARQWPALSRRLLGLIDGLAPAEIPAATGHPATTPALHA